MVDFVDGEDPFDPRVIVAKAEDVLADVKTQEQKVVDFLRVRQEMYRRVFAGKGSEDDVRGVMTDLKAFCRGESSTFDLDENVHKLLTGRQEVYLRIMDHLRLPLSEMVDKYTRQQTGG